MWSNNLFLDPAVLGHFPEKLVKRLTMDGVLWDATPTELAIIAANPVDCLGVNYYHPFRVQRPDISPKSLQPWMPDIYFKEYEPLLRSSGVRTFSRKVGQATDNGWGTMGCDPN
ncbi:hypothetical protein WP50_19855 [Lactiplantibacillus plantarum]|nr:hypothetical protein WP50_19855 [Lactiplantibacillus plantarum]